MLVLGEEVNGIPAEIRKRMDYFVEIPMFGRKESFNVSVATGIALWALKNAAEATIRQSAGGVPSHSSSGC